MEGFSALHWLALRSMDEDQDVEARIMTDSEIEMLEIDFQSAKRQVESTMTNVRPLDLKNLSPGNGTMIAACFRVTVVYRSLLKHVETIGR